MAKMNRLPSFLLCKSGGGSQGDDRPLTAALGPRAAPGLPLLCVKGFFLLLQENFASSLCDC